MLSTHTAAEIREHRMCLWVLPDKRLMKSNLSVAWEIQINLLSVLGVLLNAWEPFAGYIFTSTRRGDYFHELSPLSINLFFAESISYRQKNPNLFFWRSSLMVIFSDDRHLLWWSSASLMIVSSLLPEGQRETFGLPNDLPWTVLLAPASRKTLPDIYI